MINKFGNCPHCDTPLEAEWFKEYEWKTSWVGGYCTQYKTGRWRYNINYLVCPNCLKKQVMDDTYAGEWH